MDNLTDGTANLLRCYIKFRRNRQIPRLGSKFHMPRKTVVPSDDDDDDDDDSGGDADGLQEVLEAIAETAFKASDFPLILSFENHCSYVPSLLSLSCNQSLPLRASLVVCFLLLFERNSEFMEHAKYRVSLWRPNLSSVITLTHQ